MGAAIKQAIQHLKGDSGFALLNDVPVMAAALAEIDARLTALEKTASTAPKETKP